MKQVYVHGLGQTPASWDEVLEALGMASSAVCPHLGKLIQHQEVSYDNLYRAFVDFCDGLREPVDLCGLSLGGVLALHYAVEHPEKIPSANRFLTYYLDTVGRILGQYVKFQEAGLGTSEVREFQRKVRAILPKLKTGFEEQLSQLMASERFDAEADMKVMEGLLDTEGFQWEANQNGSV